MIKSSRHSPSAVAKSYNQHGKFHGNLQRSGRHMECACYFLAVTLGFSHWVFADDSTSKVREGLKLYSAEQFEEASKSFAAATESLENAKSDRAAVAAFDEACALHRNGDLELARDLYLKAGLSQDKSIAISAHFNLGVIASDGARKLAGETPETVPAEKRKELIGELTKSIDSYRHCLELDPKYLPARRNLELLRQWIKYYSDRWRETDLQKRRDETNLIQFLEYLVQTQLALRETTSSFKASTSPNSFAEMKRLQGELRDEIPYLKDKIDAELRPKETEPNAGNATTKNPKADEELERGIALLSSWADEANAKMVAAETQLSKRDGSAAAEKQKLAAEQLDQIWDAVVPFHPLLAKELAEQTQIAKQLTPNNEIEKSKGAEATKDDLPNEDAAKNEQTEEPMSQPQTLVVNDQDWTELLAKQEKALRKTRLLGPKAESELAQVESQPKPDEVSTTESANDASPTEAVPSEGTPQKVDPEAIKAGYQKAIELAPKAVQEMESAIKKLGKRDREQAATHAEEGRRILQEIQDAQPKNPQQDQQSPDKQQDKNEQQDKKDGEPKDEDKEKENQDSKGQQEKDEKDKEKREDKKSGDEDKKEKDKKDEQRQEPKVSPNRIEEALRRVREREQEKRERDRELKARVMGRVPVDKDW